MRRPLPYTPAWHQDELLSSWLMRNAAYYNTPTTSMLEQLGCTETSPAVLDRAARDCDLDLLACALGVERLDLLRMSFNGMVEPVLGFVASWARARACDWCVEELRSHGSELVMLRQWCIALATSCRRCGQTLGYGRWHVGWNEDEADLLERRAVRLCSAPELVLHDPSDAATLARSLTALAMPAPDLYGRGRCERPLLWRSAIYQTYARDKMRAADPDRPFAECSLAAQLAAVCLLDDLVHNDRVWRHLVEHDLVEPDDQE